MIRSTLRAAVPALVLAAALAGCGNNSRPVAQVDGHTLTIDDFARTVRGYEGQFPGSPEQAKAAALHELVNRDLVLAAARHAGLDSTTAYRRFSANAESQVLQAALFQQLVPGANEVSEGEMRAFWNMRATQADVRLIYSQDENIIRAAKQRLDAGDAFSIVADRFNTPGVLPPGGNLGPRSPGDLFPPLDDAIATLPVGQVGGPYSTAQGWFLMQVANRMPSHQDTYESQRTRMQMMVSQRKQRQALTGALATLEQSMHLAVLPQAPGTLFRLMTADRAPGSPHWAPNDAERKQALATWSGGAYTLDDALGDLMAPETRGPDPSSTAAIEAWIRGQAGNRVIVAEAKRRRLDEEPAIARQLRDRREQYLMEGALTVALASVSAPDPTALRAQWEQVKARYPMLRAVRVRYVASADTAALMRVLGLRGRMPLADAARAAGLATQDAAVAFPAQDVFWSQAQGAFAPMQAGEWTEPMPDMMNHVYRITELLSKEQGPVEWEQLPPQTQQKFAQSIEQKARQERYLAFVDSVRTSVRPVEMPENLTSLPWPMAPAPETAR